VLSLDDAVVFDATKITHSPRGAPAGLGERAMNTSRNSTCAKGTLSEQAMTTGEIIVARRERW